MSQTFTSAPEFDTTASDDVPGSRQTPPPMVWPTLSYADARQALGFLTEGLGFVATGVYLADDDPSNVLHAEMAWPHGGGVMLGSAPRPEGHADPRGHASTYCVVPEKADVDAVFARAVEAGARPVREPADQEYGGRSCVVADFEGNDWSLGSYHGDPQPLPASAT